MVSTTLANTTSLFPIRLHRWECAHANQTQSAHFSAFREWMSVVVFIFSLLYNYRNILTHQLTPFEPTTHMCECTRQKYNQQPPKTQATNVPTLCAQTHTTLLMYFCAIIHPKCMQIFTMLEPTQQCAHCCAFTHSLCDFIQKKPSIYARARGKIHTRA